MHAAYAHAFASVLQYYLLQTNSMSLAVAADNSTQCSTSPTPCQDLCLPLISGYICNCPDYTSLTRNNTCLTGT